MYTVLYVNITIVILFNFILFYGFNFFKIYKNMITIIDRTLANDR